MSTSCYSLVSRGRGTIHSPKAFGIIYHLVAVVLPRGRQIELRRLCQSDVERADVLRTQRNQDSSKIHPVLLQKRPFRNRLNNFALWCQRRRGAELGPGLGSISDCLI